jgi:hypothetical protein
MSIAVWSHGRYRPLENKTVLIDPQGRIVFQFLKAHHTPGPEMTMAQISDGKMPVDETAPMEGFDPPFATTWTFHLF